MTGFLRKLFNNGLIRSFEEVVVSTMGLASRTVLAGRKPVARTTIIENFLKNGAKLSQSYQGFPLFEPESAVKPNHRIQNEIQLNPSRADRYY